MIGDVYIDAPCIFVIENWEYAESMTYDYQKRYSLNKYMGIFFQIYYMKYNDNDELEMLVDGTSSSEGYTVLLFFKNPKLSLIRDDRLKYSFDDKRVSKFSCADGKKIELHFEGYYDLIGGVYMDTPCIFVIENWEYAKSMTGDDQRRYDIYKYMEILSLILYMKYNDDNELEMLVKNTNDRYVTLFFKNPKLSLCR